MYVGIIDQDLIQQTIFSPNLETMQISAYHKKQKDVVELILTSENIERYDKLYLIKNINDHIFLPKVIADSRATMIGIGFTNGKVLEHPEFDNMLPDTSIYNKFIEQKYPTMSKANQARVRLLQRAGHYRMKIGDKKLELPVPTPASNLIIIYDYDFDIEEMVEFCKNYKSVHFKFPVYIKKVDDIPRIAGKEWLNFDNQLLYNGELTEKEFKVLAQSIKAFNKTVTIVIDRKSLKSPQLEFRKWLNRILYSYTRGLSIKFKIENATKNEFYSQLFSTMARWVNKHYMNHSFLERYKPNNKNREKFDNLCKRDYNINRMVRLVPKDLKKECVWEYVD